MSAASSLRTETISCMDDWAKCAKFICGRIAWCCDLNRLGRALRMFCTATDTAWSMPQDSERSFRSWLKDRLSRQQSCVTANAVRERGSDRPGLSSTRAPSSPKTSLTRSLPWHSPPHRQRVFVNGQHTKLRGLTNTGGRATWCAIAQPSLIRSSRCIPWHHGILANMPLPIGVGFEASRTNRKAIASSFLHSYGNKQKTSEYKFPVVAAVR